MRKASAKKLSRRSTVSTAADKLVETYKMLGFSPSETHVEQTLARGEYSLAPVSFLPHIDYTISSVEVGA